MITRMFRNVFASALLLLMGCSGAGRDSELEASIFTLIEADEVFSVSTFGNLVVTVAGKSAFELDSQERERIAGEIAALALAQDTDAGTVVVGFAIDRPEARHVAYAWRVVDGKLQRIEELGGEIVRPGGR